MRVEVVRDHRMYGVIDEVVRLQPAIADEPHDLRACVGVAPRHVLRDHPRATRPDLDEAGRIRDVRDVAGVRGACIRRRGICCGSVARRGARDLGARGATAAGRRSAGPVAIARCEGEHYHEDSRHVVDASTQRFVLA